MLAYIKTFRADEDGAVTVDWVVLTAAIVGLGIAVLTAVGGGVDTLSTSIAGDLAAINPSTGTGSSARVMPPDSALEMSSTSLTSDKR